MWYWVQIRQDGKIYMFEECEDEQDALAFMQDPDMIEKWGSHNMRLVKSKAGEMPFGYDVAVVR